MKDQRTVKLYDSMTDVDNQFIQEAAEAPTIKAAKFSMLKKWGAIAACLCLALTLVVSMSHTNDVIQLSENSSNVKVSYTKKAPEVTGEACLIHLTEEELFTHFNTAIVKGTVEDIQNIELDFNGDKEYRAIAKIKVENVQRGTCQPGETISVLLPCPIGENMYSTTCNTISTVKIGMTGIFMPVIYDGENSFWEQNGAKLDKKDIADYGFADGQRYMFLDTENGLVFDRNAYKSIEDASTLEEIEEYIAAMLSKIG